MPHTTAHDIETYQRWRQACFYPKSDLPLPNEVLRRESASASIDETLIAQACALSLHEPVIVEPLATGTFHQIWRVQRLTGDPLVFRANALSDWFRDYALHIDAAIGQRLSESGLPGLHVQRVDTSRARLPVDYAIVEEARGVALQTLDHDEGKTLLLLRELGKFLARVHRINLAGYGLLDVRSVHSPTNELLGSHAAWDDFIWLNLEKHVRTCVASGAITAEEGRGIEWYCKGCRGLFTSGQASLLHGDPGSHNVFVKDGAISALIDWEDALAGDPVFEIAFWATFQPARRHTAFIHGYAEVTRLPADFDLRFWLYFLRVALAKTVLRHRLGIVDQPGREPAAQRIRTAFAKLTALSR